MRASNRSGTREPATSSPAPASVIATKRPTCGTIDVYHGTTLLKRVVLTSTTTLKRQFIPITTSGSRTGAITIKVVSSGRPVRIEGLAVTR